MYDTSSVQLMFYGISCTVCVFIKLAIRFNVVSKRRLRCSMQHYHARGVHTREDTFVWSYFVESCCWAPIFSDTVTGVHLMFVSS